MKQHKQQDDGVPSSSEYRWVTHVLLQRHRLRDRPVYAGEFKESKYATMTNLRGAMQSIKRVQKNQRRELSAVMLMAARYGINLQVVRRCNWLQKRLADYAHKLVTIVKKKSVSIARAKRLAASDEVKVPMVKKMKRSATSYASARAALVCKKPLVVDKSLILRS